MGVINAHDKLTAIDAKNIIAMHQKGFANIEIERILGISSAPIGRIIKVFYAIKRNDIEFLCSKYTDRTYHSNVVVTAEAIGYDLTKLETEKAPVSEPEQQVIQEPPKEPAAPVISIDTEEIRKSLKELSVGLHYISKQMSMVIGVLEKIPNVITENRKVIDADFDVLVGECEKANKYLESVKMNTKKG